MQNQMQNTTENETSTLVTLRRCLQGLYQVGLGCSSVYIGFVLALVTVYIWCQMWGSQVQTMGPAQWTLLNECRDMLKENRRNDWHAVINLRYWTPTQNWVAVKEFNLRYYIGATLLFTRYTHYGTLSQP